MPFTAHAANRIELSGVTGERKQNVELYLSSIAPSEMNPSARFKNRVNRDIKLALRGLGYYQVVVDFEDQHKGKDYVLHAKSPPINMFISRLTTSAFSVVLPTIPNFCNC